MATIYLLTNDAIAFFDDALTTSPAHLIAREATDTLALAETVFIDIIPLRITVTDQFTVIDVAVDTGVAPIKNIIVADYLNYEEKLVRPIELAASDLLALTHSARTVLWEQLTDTLNFVEAPTYTRGSFDTFDVVDEALVNIVKALAVTDSLSLLDGVSIYAADLRSCCAEINIFTVPNDVADYDPAELQIPPFPATFSPVVLTYGSTSVSLTVPEFGNSFSVEQQRINRRSRGNDLIVYRDSIWPKTETLEFQFHNLTQLQGKQLLTFLNNNNGKEIQLTDHEGVKWLGFVMNPDTDLVQTGRFPDCGAFEISLRFQGVQTA